MIRKLHFLSLCVGFVGALGCGSHKADSGSAGAAGGLGSTAGTTGVAGTSGINTGTAGSTAGSSAAGTGAASSDAGANNPFNIVCDTTKTSAAMCGTTACPALPAMASQTCQINCCVNHECGTQNALTSPVAYTTQCAPPPKADLRCPSETVNGTKLTGCCNTMNQCGLITMGGGGGGLGGGGGGTSRCQLRQNVRGAMLMAQACTPDGGTGTDAGE